MLTVRLRDVTYPNWQNVAVGKHVIPNPPASADSVFDRVRSVDDLSRSPLRGRRLAGRPRADRAADRGAGAGQAADEHDAAAGDAGEADAPARRRQHATPSAQLDQINQWYRQYLRRDATPQELAAWQAHLQAGRSLQDMQAYILGSSEYFDRVGNQSSRYLTELYRNLFGRQPTAAELAQFQAQYQQYGGARSQFVQDVLRLQPAP